jgi:hypothetical protein
MRNTFKIFFLHHKISLLMVVLIAISSITAKAQTPSIDTTNVSLSAVTVSTDTVIGAGKHKLNFKITINNAATVQAVNLFLINSSGVTIASLGNYSVLHHANNFYYLQSSDNEKKTIMNKDIFFMKIVDDPIYNSCGDLKLQIIDNNGLIRTLTTTVPR